MGNSLNFANDCKYARFVDGTEEQGYSKHLVSYINKDPSVLSGPINEETPTVVHAFRNTAKRIPNCNFLGYRNDKLEDRPYKWMTFRECDEYISNLARGIKSLNMMPDIYAEG